MISNVLVATKGRGYLGKIILNLSVKCETMYIIKVNASKKDESSF